MNKKKVTRTLLFVFGIFACLTVSRINTDFIITSPHDNIFTITPTPPALTGRDGLLIDDNVSLSDFHVKDTSTEFETYAPLDELGRCGIALCNLGKGTMPADNDVRGDISSVKPSGWKQAYYDGQALYNRGHLVAWCLSAENDNPQNLTTLTRYANNNMLVVEEYVADYLDHNPNNHVLYKVVPNFTNSELVARTIEIFAYSVEDNGAAVRVHATIKNKEPGIEIDYKTGKSRKQNGK